MTESIALRCRVCGGDFAFPAGDLLHACPACGTSHARPRATGQGLVDLRRAHQQRMNCDITNAEASYQCVLRSHPEEAEALWGLALCKYGVEYVRDEKSGEFLPVIHFLKRLPFTEDPDFRLAIARAQEDVRSQYRQDAEYIARIQQRKLTSEQRGDAWDIFLCYKASVPGQPDAHTREFDHARDLYLALHDAGYSVFFAHQTLRHAAGADYEAQIFHALQSAKVMLVIVSEPGYLRTPWVHSEWSRYLERIDDHQDCRLIPLLYDGCDPYTLPDEFVRRSIQGLNMGTITALDDLRHIIDKQLCKTPSSDAAIDGATTEMHETLTLIKWALEDGDWENAEEKCLILIKRAPLCAEARLFLLLAQRKTPDMDELAASEAPFDSDKCWRRAWEVATPALRKQMEDCLSAYKAARRAAEEKARREAEEARRAAEEKARRDAEEAARRAAEEKARRDAEEAARRVAEEKARRDAEEAARHAAEAKARRDAEEAARRAAEEKARRDAEKAARRAAEEWARTEAARKRGIRETTEAKQQPSNRQQKASTTTRSASRSEAALTEDAERLREAMRLAHDRIGTRNSGKSPIVATNPAATPSIAAGAFHSITLRADGSVIAVGSNGYGQCDVRNWKGIIAIAAGAYHTIGLQADGSVVAVGWNNFNQRKISSWKDIVAIAAGVHHTVGLRADGSVVAVGGNKFHQLYVGGWKDIVAITAGAYHTIGLQADGSVVAVGDNNDSQCDVSDWKSITAISAGAYHTVGLRADGSVVSVGYAEHGQCDVSGWNNIVAIAAGESHTVGLRADGTVIAVGNNDYNQCDISGWKNVVAIAAGNRHTIGLRADGTMVAAGSNSLSQCSISSWRLRPIPRPTLPK